MDLSQLLEKALSPVIGGALALIGVWVKGEMENKKIKDNKREEADRLELKKYSPYLLWISSKN